MHSAMRKALVCLLLTLLAFPANAGQFLFAEGGGSPPAYSGPFDALGVSLPIWYSLRAASAAAATAGTQPLVALTASGISQTCDILPATNGDLGVTSAGCTSHTGVNYLTFCALSAGSCTVHAMYNLGTGGSANDATTAGAGFDPVFNATATNGHACAQMDRSVPQKLLATWVTQAQPFNIAAVGYRNSTASAFSNDLLANGSTQFGFGSGSAVVFMFAGGTSATTAAADNTFHSLQALVSGTSTAVTVDGTTGSTTSAGTTGLSNSATASQIGGSSGSNNLTGFFCEGGVGGFTSQWTPTQYTNLYNNEKAWFGTP